MLKALMVFSVVTFWSLMYGCVVYLILDAFTDPREHFSLKLSIGLFMLLMTLLCNWDFIRQWKKYNEKE